MKKQKKDDIHQAEKTFVYPGQLIELLKNRDITYMAIIQGESGSGKTRLILRIANEFEKVKKISEDDLTFMMVESFRAKKKESFADFLFQYKIIAIEDIDFIKGKSATQEEYAKIINQLLKAGSHVLITGIQLEWRVPILISEISEGKLIWVDM